MRTFPTSPRSRKGVEMAIGTVVMLILGIIIVGGGIAMVWNLVHEGTAFAQEVSAAQRSRLNAIYGSGQLVAIVPQSLELRAGDRGQVAIGAQSILAADETFQVDISGTGPDGQPVAHSGQAGAWRILAFSDLAVRSQHNADGLVMLAPPDTAPQGTYTFIVTVRRADGTVYDSPRVFTVRVR